MIEKLVDKNVDFLRKHLICDEDRIEVFKYSLRVIYSFIIDVISLLFFATITQTIWKTIAIMVPYVVIQVFGGGYHADTQLRCFVISLFGWFLGVFGIDYIISEYPLVGFISMAVFTTVILVYTPVLNDKHPVGGDVYKRSKKIVRVTLVVFDLLMIVSILADIELIYNALSIMQILSIVSIVAAVIKRHIKQRKNRLADEGLLDVQES